MAEAARIEALRNALRSGTPLQKYDAIDETYRLGREAETLVPDLLALFLSDEYVHCTSLDMQAFGHGVIAQRACSILSGLPLTPDLDAVRTLLRDENVHLLPEASYDQGAYIGDYGTDVVAPAAFAARLAAELGQAGFDLVPDLAENAVLEEEAIGKAARIALLRMSANLGIATPAQLTAFARAMDRVGDHPDALAPKTDRGFDMRDLARRGRQRLAKLVPDPS